MLLRQGLGALFVCTTPHQSGPIVGDMVNLGVKVSSNAGEVSRQFVRLARNQLPFAQAQALNDVAFASKAALTRTAGRWFKVRNQTWPRNAPAVIRAKKRDFPRQKAVVGLKEWAGFLDLHATGGLRRSKKGHRMAVPTRRVKRTKSGRIRKAQKPRQLRERSTFIPQKLLQNQISTRARSRRDQRVVWHTLHRRVRIKARWPFYEIIRREVLREYQPAFRRRIVNAALRSKTLLSRV